jgi:type I restriction-modification system DNA methylase subunit
MAGQPERPAKEVLARAFENNSVFGHMHSYDLFRAWLEAAWAFLDAFHDREGFRKTLDHYTFEQGKEFGRMLEIYTQAVEEDPFQDILGETFMRLDVNSVRAGQFFTPMNIAEMMAKMQFDKAAFETCIQEKGYVTVCDPAVGSGVMLLAFAKVVHAELGRPALSKIRFYGTDIDLRCVLMCRIQLRMNGLDAVGRMAGLVGALERNTPAQDMTLKPGRQQDLPGIAA